MTARGKLLAFFIRHLMLRHASAGRLLELVRAVDMSLRLEEGLERLKNLKSLRPLSFIDIGARGELHPVAERHLDRIFLLLIEPEPEAGQDLVRRYCAHPNIAVRSVAIGSDFVEAVLYESRKPGASSTLPFGGVMSPLIQRNHPDLSRFEVIRTHQISLQPLSSICERADIIKIDTQGTSLDVLKGLGDLRPFVIQLEAETAEIYLGESTIFAIGEELGRLGYFMVHNGIDFEPLDPRSDGDYRLSIQLSGDVFFAPDLSEAGRAIVKNNEEQFLIACCMFGLQDYTDWLLSK